MSNDKTPAEGPYTVFFTGRGALVRWRVKGPGVAPMDGYWLSQEHAQDQADTLNAAYLAGQASQSSAALSKDYEKLYDHLLGGGEALGVIHDKREGSQPFSMVVINDENGPGLRTLGWCWGMTTEWPNKTDFIAECQRLNLEWIAPAPVGPTIDQIMEVVEKVLSNGNYLDPVFDPKDLKLMDADLRKRLSSLFK